MNEDPRSCILLLMVMLFDLDFLEIYTVTYICSISIYVSCMTFCKFIAFRKKESNLSSILFF